MNRSSLLRVLADVQTGALTPEAASDALAHLPFEDAGFATIDHHRSLRSGMPEVIFASGKTAEQTSEIFLRLSRTGINVLATRVDVATYMLIQKHSPAAIFHELSGAVTLEQGNVQVPAGKVTVICAGTSDLPIAEEAAVTATLFGAQVDRINDVGVAGIHRLLAHRERIAAADAIVVCAGMEGALPSVVGGMVAVPVVAVPTSVGYGASFAGAAALLGMLNSCSPNVTVVNIDNGFGAGYVATLIARGPRS